MKKIYEEPTIDVLVVNDVLMNPNKTSDLPIDPDELD